MVSCRDLAGIEHAVEVTAKSLYEAAAQALGILRGDNLVEEIGEGLPEFRRWLESSGKSSAEQRGTALAALLFTKGISVRRPAPTHYRDLGFGQLNDGGTIRALPIKRL